jgi:hypothetical protein
MHSPASPLGRCIKVWLMLVGSSFSGLPLGLAQGEINRQIDGASIKGKRFAKKNMLVEGGTLVAGVPSVMRMGNNPQIRCCDESWESLWERFHFFQGHSLWWEFYVTDIRGLLHFSINKHYSPNNKLDIIYKHVIVIDYSQII